MRMVPPKRQRPEISTPVKLDYFALAGGLDLVSPPFTIKPGFCRESQNYEIGVNGGYRRVDGYERYSGQPRPADAVYYVLPCTITGAVVAGNTVTGAVSGATGYVIAVEAAAVVITKLTGTFNSSEGLTVAAAPVATMTDSPVRSGGSTNQLQWQYKNLAGDVYRADIAVVPGSGSILGVWYYNANLYAFRNNAGSTAAVMHVAAVAGWTEVALGRELVFTSGGTTEIAVGDTITGATSGATAVVTGIALTDGTWAGGDAAGKFTFASQTGTFQAENLNVGATLNLATIAGNSSAITMLPSGRFEFVNYNFSTALKMYGCDGENRAFEFDGTTFIQIDTGMAADTPNHIAAHVNHLFLAFDNSLQHSSIGDPLAAWSVVSGAGEINAGETITNLMPQTGDSSGSAMLVWTRNTTQVLYGTSSADWKKVMLQSDAGAFHYTAQFAGQPFVFDDRGITTLQNSQNYGNFDSASVSKLIRPYIVENKARVIASGISRDKNQYRVFFTGGRALYMTVGGGFMSVLYADDMTCYVSSEDASGNEVAFAGDTAGYVYQMDTGTSFDGDDIEAYSVLAFNHVKSPRTRKQYRKAVLEVGGTGYATFWMSAELAYGDTGTEAIPLSQLVADLSAGSWDSGTWDVGVWDGRILAPAEYELTGTAENISLRIAQTSDYQPPLTFSGVLLHYTPRRNLR